MILICLYSTTTFQTMQLTYIFCYLSTWLTLYNVAFYRYENQFVVIMQDL